MPAAITRSCPQRVLCDTAPLENLSAEAPDRQVAVSVFFPTVNTPLGQTFISTGCVGVCTSTISQEDADLCAARQATQCVITGGGGGTLPPPIPVCSTPGGCAFVPPPDGGGGNIVPPHPGSIPCNTQQVCCVYCPDGSQFCYTVPPCTFFGTTVAEADAIAFSYACKQAEISKICLTGDFSPACVSEGYIGGIVVIGGTSPSYTWSLIAGALPPGLTMQPLPPNSLEIHGTPTATGSFTFTIRVADTRGNFMVKTYTIRIFEITSSAPPDATLGQPYSFQFTADGGIPPYSFTVTNGQLPEGLTLTTGGLLSGTPTTAESVNFTVCVTDSST